MLGLLQCSTHEELDSSLGDLLGDLVQSYTNTHKVIDALSLIWHFVCVQMRYS